MPIDVVMPPLSQTMDTLVVVEWLKRVGDDVRKGEPLFLVESDKATLEVEAPVEGVLYAILVEPGTEVRVKTPIAQIAVRDEASNTESLPRTPAAMPAPAVATTVAAHAAARDWLPPTRARRIMASPRARERARVANVALASIPASGPQGMIVERDVVAYLANQPAPVRVSPVARRMASAEGVDIDALAQAKRGQRIQRADVAEAMEGVRMAAPDSESSAPVPAGPAAVRSEPWTPPAA